MQPRPSGSLCRGGDGHRGLQRCQDRCRCCRSGGWGCWGGEQSDLQVTSVYSRHELHGICVGAELGECSAHALILPAQDSTKTSPMYGRATGVNAGRLYQGDGNMAWTGYQLARQLLVGPWIICRG